MKYRIGGALLCICILLTAVVAPLTTEQTRRRHHQHLEAPVKAPCSHEDDTLCTHLPLVSIDTGGAEIPGRPILDDAGNRLYTTAPDGSPTTAARLTVMDRQKKNNHPDDAPTLESAIQIRIRGRSSRHFDKPGYAIRLVDEAGLNRAMPMMGMDAHHEWALHGPILDKTLIRNYMWYNLAGELMDYAPNVRFCELILNGEYRGLYLMTETITAGREGARLSLSVDKKDNTFSGYLLRLDMGDTEGTQNLRNFTAYTLRTDMVVEIIYPGRRNLSEPLRRAIDLDFSSFEKALYSYDFDDPKEGYRAYLDTESFVDYFLLNELACNYDAGRLSTYMYKGLDNRYRMCVWDFNSACDNYQEFETGFSHFELQTVLWYNQLFKDEAFTEQVISRYRQLRKSYFDEEYLMNYIDDTIGYLGDARIRNYRIWGYSFAPQHDMLTPRERNPRSYAEAVADMKQFLRRRLQWMDENIESLRQYSAKSKVKQSSEIAG